MNQEVINRKNIVILDAVTKKDALLELVTFLYRDFPESDVQTISEAITYRENLMSTGIGLGIGVPHTRTSIVSEPLVVFGLCRNALSDYDSMDGQPVRYIVMILTGVGQHKEHTMILSKVVSIFRRGNALARLSAASSPDEVHEIIGGAA